MFNLKNSESLIISSSPNVYYYSGIRAEGGVFLLFTARNKFVCADARFIKEAARVARGFIPLATDKKDANWWKDALKKHRIKTVYFEPFDFTYYKLGAFRRLSRSVAVLKPSAIDFRALRSIKNARELFCIRRAVRIAEEILVEIKQLCLRRGRSKPAPTERDLVLEIHKRALLRGCEELAFSPIVAFGRNSGIPHHQSSSRRRLKKGDMVLIDMGVKYRGYCSDITRTFFTAPPPAKQVEVYNRVLSAQTSAIALIKNGVKASEAYQAAVVELGGLAPHITHGLGHGVGLEIHEHPNLKPKSPDILRTGQVITVEPGLYFNWGGVRIEDMVVVEKNSCAMLTAFPRDIKESIF
jgi:Xaa-Pro aminopeptidase